MSNIDKTAERRKFRMDPNLLWSVIKSQAGSIGKAILELAQNSVDASSTRLDVTLTNTHLTVQDDGKGFSSRKEIEDFFETFGTPHQAGDSIFGKFRMGRGQVMSFTRNIWTSGEYSMKVDIKGMGLEYDLVKLDSPVAGCRIEGELYNPLKSSELIRLVDELRELCKYLPIPMFVNGERISKDPATMKWTHEDDDAYYLIRDNARSMEVFNLGVLVRHYYSGEFGVCGMVISKQQLQVNFARTDVLVGECEVFKRITAKLKQMAKSEDDEKTPRNNEAAREFKLDAMLTGAFESDVEFVEAVASAKVITDFSGKHMSIMGLYTASVGNGRGICAPWVSSQKADRVHQKKLAVVISPKTAERAKGLSFVEMLQRIEKNLKAFGSGSAERSASYVNKLIQAVKDVEVVGAMIDDSRTIVALKELTKEERLVLGVLNKLGHYFASAAEQSKVRKLGVFVSDAADGFTDGSSMVFINRKFLKIGGAAGNILVGFDRLKALMLHEYLHDAEDITGHSHPAEFYESFHQKMCFSWNMSRFTYDASMLYLSGRRKAGLKLRAGDLSALDMLLQEDILITEVATDEVVVKETPDEESKQQQLPLQEETGSTLVAVP